MTKSQFNSEEALLNKNVHTQTKVQNVFLSRVYGWMVLALSLSGFAAWFAASSPFMIKLLYGNPFTIFILIIAELALVVWLSSSIRKMSVQTASLAFLAYAILNGLTLSSIFLVYTARSITQIFFISALMFGSMSLYGARTKTDLTKFGKFFSMALIGIIVAIVINFLLRSSGLDILISIITVVVFTGLTAYDTQKLLSISKSASDSEPWQKFALFGALQLYLDFVNLFLALLRLFGKRK